jgi:hypothetical protein
MTNLDLISDSNAVIGLSQLPAVVGSASMAERSISVRCNPLVFPDHLEVEGYRDFATKYGRGAMSPRDSCGRISL